MSPDSVGSAIHEVRTRGFSILRSHLPGELIDACRNGFLPHWHAFTRQNPESNRGPHRYFLPMPFEPPCFSPRFFADPDILRIVRGVMDDRIVSDQWGCDVPLEGSQYQQAHADYARPLFGEAPDLVLPPFALVASFGLVSVGPLNGALEIAPGTHAWTRSRAVAAIEADEIRFEAVLLEIGDVLIRNPWTLHRGTPNTTGNPRFMASLRYVRRWYADDSREVRSIPRAVWELLSTDCRELMRFPVEG